MTSCLHWIHQSYSIWLILNRNYLHHVRFADNQLEHKLSPCIVLSLLKSFFSSPKVSWKLNFYWTLSANRFSILKFTPINMLKISTWNVFKCLWVLSHMGFMLFSVQTTESSSLLPNWEAVTTFDPIWILHFRVNTANEHHK